MSRSAASGSSNGDDAAISTAEPSSCGGVNAGSPPSRAARERDGEAKGRSRAGRARHRDPSAHALDDALGDRQAEAGAAEPPGRSAVGLLELAEDAGLRVRRDADAGVAHRERDRIGGGPRLDDHREPALLGELHRIAGEVEQHLAQAASASPVTRARQRARRRRRRSPGPFPGRAAPAAPPPPRSARRARTAAPRARACRPRSWRNRGSR